MAPKPTASSRPVDIAPARPRPMLSVAIAIARVSAALYRYSAGSCEQRWTGTAWLAVPGLLLFAQFEQGWIGRAG